jgi:hypothetical protein
MCLYSLPGPGPSPRARFLSAKGPFPSLKASPRVSSRRRPLGSAVPQRRLRREQAGPFSADMRREAQLALGEGFSRKKRKNPASGPTSAAAAPPHRLPDRHLRHRTGRPAATCIGRHLHHRAPPPPKTDRERGRVGGGRAGVSPQIRRCPTSSFSPDDGSEGGGDEDRRGGAARHLLHRRTLVGRGDGAGFTATSLCPAAAPRHEVRGERRGEVGDGATVPGGGGQRSCEGEVGGADLAGRRRRRRQPWER